MDNRVPITTYMKDNGLTQDEMRKLLHFNTQSAVSQLLRSDRDVFITEKAKGEIEAFEIKKLGGKKTESKLTA